MAADSAATIQGDGLMASTETVCKIYQIDSWVFFAVSGLVNDAHSGFSTPQIAAAAARDGGSLDVKLARIERQVTGAVLRELQRVRKT